jgi:hypothetical protein
VDHGARLRGAHRFHGGAHTYLFGSYRVDEYSCFNETTNIARSIDEGRGLSSPFGAAYTGPTSWIAPVYPYLCALFFVLFGVFGTHAAVALLILQSLISALTCVPILAIASAPSDAAPDWWRRCSGRDSRGSANGP